MDFEIIKEVTNILTDIQKYIDVENFLIMNNDEQNILAGLHYDKFEISEKDKLKIIGKFKKLNKKLEINHIIINNHICMFQGTLKGDDKECEK